MGKSLCLSAPRIPVVSAPVRPLSIRWHPAPTGWTGMKNTTIVRSPYPPTPKGWEISVPEIWWYMALTAWCFYEKFSSGYSYTRLGSIGNPDELSAALGNGNVEVTLQTAWWIFPTKTSCLLRLLWAGCGSDVSDSINVETELKIFQAKVPNLYTPLYKTNYLLHSAGKYFAV